MGVIWWILPAIAGVVGLMLLFAGLGKVFKLKPFSGATRLLFSVGFLGLAGVIAMTGLNLQTYKRLTYERPIATLTFDAVDTQPGAFAVDVLLEGGEHYMCDGIEPSSPTNCVVTGDEFALGARVITFKPLANMLGYDAVYKLDYLEGRQARRYAARSVSPAQTNGVALSDNPGFDVAAFARERGGQFGIRDANFGSAVYNPIGDGFSYDVSLTRTGLIARPANAETRRALGELVGEPATAQNTSVAESGDEDAPE
ncbi:MAG: hypothetical protein AAFO51_01165 [Pseudomonadota bacterium]